MVSLATSDATTASEFKLNSCALSSWSRSGSCDVLFVDDFVAKRRKSDEDAFVADWLTKSVKNPSRKFEDKIWKIKLFSKTFFTETSLDALRIYQKCIEY